MKRTLLSAMLVCIAIAAAAQGYTNPVVRGFNPDPSVCRVGEDYLLECAVPENVKEELEQIQILLKMYEDDKAEDALRELIQKL